MSNKLQNRVLNENGSFSNFPIEKVEKEVKYEQTEKDAVKKMEKVLEKDKEPVISSGRSKATKNKLNSKAKKTNKKLAEKQEKYESDEKIKEINSKAKK